MPPDVAPRWLALATSEELLVVRFDDVTRTEEVTLSARVDGEQVDPALVYWSPSGEHVAFVTTDSAGAPSLWLASANDGFARRAVAQPPPGEQAAVWGPAPSDRALFWIGPSAFVLRVPSDEGIAFYRVAVDSLVSEWLGSYVHEADEFGWAEDNVLSAASRFGFLFSAGSRSQADLLFAGETGAPRRLGRALSAIGDPAHYAAAELVWAPDGESAAFWTRAVGDEPSFSPVSTQFSLADAEAPALELEANGHPAIGLVHVPRGLYVDAHPHGNLTFSYEFVGRALAPQGAAVAYTLRHQRLKPAYQLISGVPRSLPPVPGSSPHGIEGGVGSLPQFGFLDATSLIYPKVVPSPDSTAEISIQCVVRRGGEERVISVDRYAPNYFAALAGSERLFFVREDVARRAQLFAVDLGEPSAMAAPVPLPGSVLRDSVLPQGHTWPTAPSAYGTQGGSDAGLSLLVSTSTAKEECWQVCETQRFVVDLSHGVDVSELEPRWLYAPVNWAVDGSGLLAVDKQGLSFVPSTGFRGSFLLSAKVGAAIIPDRWPLP